MTETITVVFGLLVLASISFGVREGRRLVDRFEALVSSIPGRIVVSLEQTPPKQPPDTTIWQALKVYTPQNATPGPGGAPPLPQYRVEKWVREGTPAWQRAYETPGVYLRRSSPDGSQTELVEGLQ